MPTTREHFRDNKFKANSLKVKFRLVKTKTQKIKRVLTQQEKKKGLKQKFLRIESQIGYISQKLKEILSNNIFAVYQISMTSETAI